MSYGPSMQPEKPPLPPNAALDVLQGFLDVTGDTFDRHTALNDSRVADSVVAGLLRTLNTQTRLTALFLCDRPSILREWALVGIECDRIVVAANTSTEMAVLLGLASDESEDVRCEVAVNASADLDAVARLLADPSPRVQSALSIAFSCRRESQDIVGIDNEPGDAESLTFLCEMVGAAEEEECLADWMETAHRKYCEDLVRESQHADWRSAEDCDEASCELEEDEEPWMLTHAQALGLLQHHLGAREVGD